MPLPLEKIVCAEEAREETNEPKASATHINLVWNVALAPVSPVLIAWEEMISSNIEPFNLTDSDFNKAQDQLFFEKFREFTRSCSQSHILNTLPEWIMGHKFSENRHTGRAIILEGIGAIAHLVRSLLLQHYWFTRTSTAGISTIGARFLAASYGVQGLKALFDCRHAWDFSSFVTIHSPSFLLFLSICKTLFRLRIERTVPFIKSRLASRLERASVRLEAGAGSLTLLGVSSTQIFQHQIRY